ncbi:MAG: ParA family protein [Eubacteriales bacterium]
MVIYSISNQKGGVGKTTTAQHLAIGLAKEGKKVLVVDLDPQGSLTILMGVKNPDELDVTISTMLNYTLDGKDFDPRSAIMKHEENIDFIPSNIELSGMELKINSAYSREYFLARYLDMLQDDYDVCVIDCSPNLGIITVNALSCADEVIIPVLAQYLAVKGMEQLLDTIGNVKRYLNKKLEIRGILVTMVDHRTKYSREMIPFVREQYGEAIEVFQSVIPASTRVIETSSKGKSIYEYEPEGKVATAYLGFVTELVGTMP